MSKRPRRQAEGTTLVVTLATLTAISLMAAYTLARVTPRGRMAYQNIAWQEARIAAEGGIDAAMGDLLTNATGFSAGSWSGWKEDAAPTGNPLTGVLAPPGLLKQLLDAPVDRVTKILARMARRNAKKGTASTDNSVATTAPIYLDNLKVSTVGAVPAEVDIRLWALTPANDPHSQWFRIRATATCALPPVAYEGPANMDGLLRRFSLRKTRASLQKELVGAPSTIPLPNISRTVEALVEPIRPYELALWCGQSLSLAAMGAWDIDSFDSSDDAKSNAGLYPGRGSPLLQVNGNIASTQARPYASRYGPLIAANGARVQGALATNGGDDPATEEHENVSGTLHLDPRRIMDNFTRDMPLVARPTVLLPLPPPLTGSYQPGTEAKPNFYSVPGSVTSLKIPALAGGAPGSLVIMIDGDLDLAKPLIIPPTVVAIIFVRGNITLRDSVNSGPWNSNRAGQLLLFGDNSTISGQTLQVFGASSVTAAFYGPNTNIAVDGGVQWIGSLAGKSFRVANSGDGGIHYDAALATVGPAISYRISRYVEDVRE